MVFYIRTEWLYRSSKAKASRMLATKTQEKHWSAQSHESQNARICIKMSLFYLHHYGHATALAARLVVVVFDIPVESTQKYEGDAEVDARIGAITTHEMPFS